MQFVDFISDVFKVVAWIVLIFSILISILALSAYIVLQIVDIIKEVLNGRK
jgi:hypothetical protein